jgi:hypothetical protein
LKSLLSLKKNHKLDLNDKNKRHKNFDKKAKKKKSEIKSRMTESKYLINTN